jgi:hypothetical protein
MKIKAPGLFSLLIIFISAIFIISSSGCANIIPPAGGPRDSLPPVLVAAAPRDSSTNFTANRINLTFDEFVEINNAFENVLVSPTPDNVPIISYHFRDVTVRIKDTLEPNTTYSIDFGNALRDVNEGNVFKNFTYVFSTGRTIDQNTVSGKVVMAETGKIDSTLIVVLHRNLEDSAVAKEKPRYIAKLDGKGNFTFRYLPAGTFALYAIPNDFSHHYDDTTKPFAFLDSTINTTQNTPLTLYAYQLAKTDTAAKTAKPQTASVKDRKKQDKPLLRFQTNLQSGKQDLLDSLELTFSQPIKTFDTTKIVLANKDFTPVTGYTIVADTNKTRFSIIYNWPANIDFNLLISKDAFTDSTGVQLTKNDTVSFTTKREEDYGNVRLRFRNLDLTKNPVLQILQNDKLIESVALTSAEWSRKLFNPGDYDLRILYDSNKNGKWDPGKFFGVHKQPEIVVPINAKLTIRGSWDNEKEFTL